MTMNHIPAALMALAGAPMTRRGLAKLRTRETLLAAAKRLITERGYEDATVRDIAKAAGMSTGAVFANFSDKADLFHHVLAEDARVLAETMRQVAALRDEGVRETLLTVLAAGYAFHLKQLPLLQAAYAESWRRAPSSEAAARGRMRQIIAILEGVLRQAVAIGELRSEIDMDLAVDLIWRAYQSNYRLAIYDGFDLDALTGRLERQLDLILPSLVLRQAA
ncbi:MAG: helix-turn-helix domain-containing protein [Alphaproteobacteria bacterium]